MYDYFGTMRSTRPGAVGRNGYSQLRAAAAAMNGNPGGYQNSQPMTLAGGGSPNVVSGQFLDWYNREILAPLYRGQEQFNRDIERGTGGAVSFPQNDGHATPWYQRKEYGGPIDVGQQFFPSVSQSAGSPVPQGSAPFYGPGFQGNADALYSPFQFNFPAPAAPQYMPQLMPGLAAPGNIAARMPHPELQPTRISQGVATTPTFGSGFPSFGRSAWNAISPESRAQSQFQGDYESAIADGSMTPEMAYNMTAQRFADIGFPVPPEAQRQAAQNRLRDKYQQQSKEISTFGVYPTNYYSDEEVGEYIARDRMFDRAAGSGPYDRPGAVDRFRRLSSRDSLNSPSPAEMATGPVARVESFEPSQEARNQMLIASAKSRGIDPGDYPTIDSLRDAVRSNAIEQRANEMRERQQFRREVSPELRRSRLKAYRDYRNQNPKADAVKSGVGDDDNFKPDSTVATAVASASSQNEGGQIVTDWGSVSNRLFSDPKYRNDPASAWEQMRRLGMTNADIASLHDSVKGTMFGMGRNSDEALIEWINEVRGASGADEQRDFGEEFERSADYYIFDPLWRGMSSQYNPTGSVFRQF